MSDETPDPVTDDQGNADQVVPAELPPAQDVPDDYERPLSEAERNIGDLAVSLAAAEAKVTELEAKVADLETYVADLEADPYRAPAGGDDAQLGVVTPEVLAYNAQQVLAEQQAYDRDVQPLIDAGLAVVDDGSEWPETVPANKAGESPIASDDRYADNV